LVACNFKIRSIATPKVNPAVGWGVPTPLPVKSRRYDDAFWKELLGGGGKKSEAQNLKELGF